MADQWMDGKTEASCRSNEAVRDIFHQYLGNYVQIPQRGVIDVGKYL